MHVGEGNEVNVPNLDKNKISKDDVMAALKEYENSSGGTRKKQALTALIKTCDFLGLGSAVKYLGKNTGVQKYIKTVDTIQQVVENQKKNKSERDKELEDLLKELGPPVLNDLEETSKGQINNHRISIVQRSNVDTPPAAPSMKNVPRVPENDSKRDPLRDKSDEEINQIVSILSSSNPDNDDVESILKSLLPPEKRELKEEKNSISQKNEKENITEAEESKKPKSKANFDDVEGAVNDLDKILAELEKTIDKTSNVGIDLLHTDIKDLNFPPPPEGYPPPPEPPKG